MNQQVQVIVECGADKDSEKFPFTRKHYLHPNDTDQFRNFYNNAGVYHTVMNYINPVWFQNERGKWLVNAKDSFKYGDFYLDFDNVIEKEEDFLKIKADVRQALKYLKLFLNISIEQVRFFFSGNKGVHLIVDAQTIGLEPHIALNSIYKDMADDIKKYCKYETLDTGVYDDKRMFRMVNSINKKSGLYKIPITAKELNDLTYAQIAELARNPRMINTPTPIKSDKATRMFADYVRNWSEKIERSKTFTGKIRQLKELPPCIKAMHENVFKETVDRRNQSGTSLTSFYFQQGLEREETMQIMLKWGIENCSPSLNHNDIKTIVNSVYNGQYRYGCSSFKELSGVCDKENCPLFKNELTKGVQTT